MTGAGAATLAFGLEDSFLGSVSGGPDYFAFGRDPTLSEASIDNQLAQLQEPDSVWSVESVKNGFEGAVTVEAVVNEAVFPSVEDIVFNGTDSSGNKAIVAGRPQTAKVFVGIDYLDGTSERTLEGCIPTSLSLDRTQDGRVRYTLSMLYADESIGSSITPTSITQASQGGTAAAQDFGLDIDGTTVTKLQSATLSIDNIARFQRGGSPTPADVVVAAPEATLDATAIYSGPSRLERALGSASATGPQDRVDGVSATVSLDNDGTAISSYQLETVKPATYDWSDIVSDSDATDPVTFNVTGEEAVTVA